MVHVKSKRSNFQTTVDDRCTDLYCLRGKGGIEMAVSNFGARVIELWVPDRNGAFTDIVLGHDHIEKYVRYDGERFLGSTIGRFGNRISKGQFELNGKKYQLPLNNGPNSLHGGLKGFDMVVWEVTNSQIDSISFTYLSKDGEEGFPGNVEISMTYELSDKNEFVITHRATTDQSTILNLTHHSFFNLFGEGSETITDHQLMINADRYTPIDSFFIPTGNLEAVDSTPLDFRSPQTIGSRLNDDFLQLKHGLGYDHNWVINRKSSGSVELAASVYEPKSGRYMEVHTDQPGIQFYSGNFFDGKVIGKTGKAHRYRGAFALETQFFPDTPNHAHFPPAVLNPGEEYVHVCIYKFGIK